MADNATDNDELAAREAAIYGPGGIGGLYGMDCEAAFRKGWIAGRDYAALEAANDRARLLGEVERLKAALEAMTASSDRLLRERDRYMNRLGSLLPYLNEAQMAIVRRDALAAAPAGAGADRIPPAGAITQNPEIAAGTIIDVGRYVSDAEHLDQRINTAYEEGAENEWASIEAVANEFGDEALLSYIKDGLRSRGWTVPEAPGASDVGDKHA